MNKNNRSVGKMKLGLNKPYLQIDKFKSMLNHKGKLNTRVISQQMKLHLQVHQDVSSFLKDTKAACSLEKIDRERVKGNKKPDSQKENVFNKLSKKDYCEPQNGKSLKIELMHPKKYGNSLNPTELNSQFMRNKAKSSIQASEHSYPNKFITHFFESNQSVKEELEKSQKEFKRQSDSNKPSPSHIPLESREDRLKITQIYSDVLQFKRKLTLSCNQKTVDYFIVFDSPERAQQIFWVLCQKQSNNSEISPEKLNFLLENVNMVKSINKDLSQKTQKLQRKLWQLEQRNKEIEKQHERLDVQITNKKHILSAFQQKVIQMKKYINQQPNQFLRIMVDQYKKSQQQLFDLADFLNVTNAEKIDIWTGQTLKMAKKHHETFLNNLCDRNFDENSKCHIDKEEIEYLRGKIKASHDEMTVNFEKVLSVRIQRIKQFIALMEKIAVNTVSKRSYIDQINQKIMGNYVLIEPLQRSLEEKMAFIIPQNALEDQLRSDLLELKKLIRAAHDLYIQAQIFY